jgi:hypothetical protein
MKVWQHIYEMKTHNFLFDFEPKELLYTKNNYSLCELQLTTALGVLCTSDSDVIKSLVW